MKSKATQNQWQKLDKTSTATENEGTHPKHQKEFSSTSNSFDIYRLTGTGVLELGLDLCSWHVLICVKQENIIWERNIWL
jgi:hypothetical protein